jgi:hypothetical protein
MGSSNISSQHRSIWDPHQHQSTAMTQFFQQDNLADIRQQFFNGDLPSPFQSIPTTSRRNSTLGRSSSSNTTPQERFNGMESRLRRVVVKACTNSYAASQVISIMEEFLIRVYQKKEDTRTRTEWLQLLLEPPSVTIRPRRTPREQNQTDTTKKNNEKEREESDEKGLIETRFLFDASSSTGGFHRLLLHGVCQFHGLRAVSSTMKVSMVDNDVDKKSNKNAHVLKEARVLTATGILSGANVGLVDFITKQQGGGESSSLDILLSNEACKLAALEV